MVAALDRFGPLCNINRAIEEGTIEVDEWSGLSMVMRFLGGSLDFLAYQYSLYLAPIF